PEPGDAAGIVRGGQRAQGAVAPRPQSVRDARSARRPHPGNGFQAAAARPLMTRAPGRGDASGARSPQSSSATVTPYPPAAASADRKSTRLNSSHVKNSYAVFCLKKKNTVILQLTR